MKRNSVLPQSNTHVSGDGIDPNCMPFLPDAINSELCYGAVIANPVIPAVFDKPSSRKMEVVNINSDIEDHSEDAIQKDKDLMEATQEGSEGQLTKSMSLFHTVALAVGGIIGSGIFVSPNLVVQKTGSMGVSLLVWTFAGAFTTLGALCFGELGAMYPKSGGEYQYLRLAYGKLTSFANLWILLIVNSMGCAAMALTFATYLLTLFVDDTYPHIDIIKKVIALCALVLVTSLCIYGTEIGLWVQSIFTVLKVGALLFLVTLAFSYLVRGKFENLMSGFSGTDWNVSSWSEAALSAVWAYNGWTCINIVASEVKNPKKNLPRALYITGILITVIYVVVNVAYHTIMSTEELKQSQSIAVVAAKRFFAPYGPQAVTFGKYFFAVSVAISTFGSLLATILYASRIPYAGALEGMLPRFFSLVSLKNNSPVISLVFMGLTTAVCILPSNIAYLIQYAMYLSWLFWGFCFVAVIYLRWKLPDTPRPFKVPLVIPVLATIFAVYLVIGPFVGNPLSSSIWILVTVVSIPIYYGFVDTKTCGKGMDKIYAALSRYLTTSAKEHGGEVNFTP